MVKSTLREIRTSLTRYLAIFAIVALGVGFFSGLKICRDCMVKTASDYLNDKHYYDYQINSSYGIDDGSIKIAEGWDGVTAAEGSIRRDVLVETGSGDQKALRAISMPENINELDLVKGRFPRNSSECLIDANNMTGSGFSIGDVITVADDNDEDRLKDFRVREYTIVGSVNTPILPLFVAPTHIHPCPPLEPDTAHIASSAPPSPPQTPCPHLPALSPRPGGHAVRAAEIGFNVHTSAAGLPEELTDSTAVRPPAVRHLGHNDLRP